MAKVNNVNTTQAWGYDSLFPILKDAFRVLYLSYQIILPQRQNSKYTKKKGTPLENTFTDDLVKNSSEIPKNFIYRIQKQQEDFATNSKIDIAILYSLTFGDNSYDLKIECKRLDNINYLINDGVQSFKNNKYSRNLSIAGMLIYNVQDEIKENIEFLNEKIKEKVSIKETLNKFHLIEGYSYSYLSKHQRVSNSPVDIYTLALNFKDLIEV